MEIEREHIRDETVQEVLKIFSTSQETAACHQKNSFLLKKIYSQSNLEVFWNVLVRPINVILTTEFKNTNRYADRVIEFLGKFCATFARNQKTPCNNNEAFLEDPLIVKVFMYLLQCSNNISDTVSYRSCELINKIIEHLADSELSENLCQEMLQVLKDRLSDAKGAIRLQAVEALYPFQDPNDPENPVITELMESLYDSQAQVRQLCVEKIALTRNVSKHIIKKTRDVNPEVRVTAYKRLAKLVKTLKIADRRTVFLSAMLDTVKTIRDYVCQELLASWLQINDCNIITLLKAFRLDADEKDIELTIKIYEHILNDFYFKNKSRDEILDPLQLTNEKLVPHNRLNWETVIYWRVLVSQIVSRKLQNGIDLDALMPEVVFLCQYIKEYVESYIPTTETGYLEQQYIIKQLFLALKLLDLSDTHCMKSVRRLVEVLLKSGDLIDDVVETIIGIMDKILPKPEQRFQFAMELISDILHPIDANDQPQVQEERKFQLAKLKVELASLKADQENALQLKEYMEAERLKHVIEDISFQLTNLKNSILMPVQQETAGRTDVPTLCKCLDIAWATLRTTNAGVLTPTMRSLKDEFLPDLLSHDNEVVRLKALRCFAICCIYDKPTARQGIHIFAIPISDYQTEQECCTQLLLICIAAVSDLLWIYGNDLLTVPQDDQLSDSVNEEHEKVFVGGTSFSSLVQGLADLMDDEEYDIQLKACEGLCKLVLGERIQSPMVISRLILKWCNPCEEDKFEGDCLKQYIGEVLEMLPHLSDGAQQLEKAVLPTIETLLNAPPKSPLSGVDIFNITKFLLALCKVSSKGQTIHCNLAFSLCQKINNNPECKMNSSYSKILLMIDLPKDKGALEEMFVIIDDAREYINEKLTLKNVTKFLSILSQRIRESKDVSVIVEDPLLASLDDEELKDVEKV
ncbi:condensin complex subunit 3-like [Euwallacea similis]|uniref:condensin complex subunit 3-like n=1 Tax=Euwallacea similis TaxID=1736056 RepID=UPI00344E3D99